MTSPILEFQPKLPKQVDPRRTCKKCGAAFLAVFPQHRAAYCSKACNPYSNSEVQHNANLAAEVYAWLLCYFEPIYPKVIKKRSAVAGVSVGWIRKQFEDATKTRIQDHHVKKAGQLLATHYGFEFRRRTQRCIVWGLKRRTCPIT